MIDVRLAATNPEDSSLVPVACNARGELSTAAPKIEEIPNDVVIDGELTVTGLINGSDGVGEQGPQGEQGEQGEPGPNELLPYGAEHSYLSIKDGVPQWVLSSNEPNPPGPPDELTLSDTRDETFLYTKNFGSWGLNEALVFPPDPWNTYVRTLPTWETPGPQKMGIGGEYASTGQMEFDFEITMLGGFDKLLQITYSYKYENLEDRVTNKNLWEVTLTCDNDQLVQVSGDILENAELGIQQRTHQHVFMPMRPDLGLVRFHLKINGKGGWDRVIDHLHVQRWEYIDPAKYLLNKMRLKAQDNLITTTDIDLSRPTQD